MVEDNGVFDLFSKSDNDFTLVRRTILLESEALLSLVILLLFLMFWAIFFGYFEAFLSLYKQ